MLDDAEMDAVKEQVRLRCGESLDVLLDAMLAHDSGDGAWDVDIGPVVDLTVKALDSLGLLRSSTPPIYPFELVRDGPATVHRGRIEEEDAGGGLLRVPSASTLTAIAVCEGDGSHGNGPTLMIIDGVLWAPDAGSVIQLAEPNRDADICMVRYQIGPDGKLVSVVYIHDRQTTLPDVD